MYLHTMQMKVPLELDQVNHWLVLDGPLQASVVAALEMLAKGEGLTLPNGDILLLPRMYTIVYVCMLVVDSAYWCMQQLRTIYCSVKSWGITILLIARELLNVHIVATCIYYVHESKSIQLLQYVTDTRTV